MQGMTQAELDLGWIAARADAISAVELQTKTASETETIFHPQISWKFDFDFCGINTSAKDNPIPAGR
ncbi:hypothetical protein BV898_06827 [Hypsibius exemplaris]|uniref:Uncharacterized protein n=1 Tax=Hypsibius exemplaris TaxID=2072580 RepID=A0A1W0WVI6_HYPEX|nr:hypothetical protein BV898_06827 [Hypsibius exemplaris]